MSFFKQYRILIVLVMLVLAPMLVSQYFVYQAVHEKETCATAIKVAPVALPVAPTAQPTASPSASVKKVSPTVTKVPVRVPTVASSSAK